MMLPLYQQPHFTFHFAEDRIVPRFHLEGIEAGRIMTVFKIEPGTGERLGLLATATVGEGGWVELNEPIVVRAGEAFIAVPDNRFAEAIQLLLTNSIADSLPDPLGLRQIASKLNALPVLLDMGGCIAIRPSGEIISFCWDASDQIRVEESSRLRNMAIFQGSKKYPALQEFIPSRPIDAVSCPHCQGTGEFTGRLKKVVCYCGGLGWLPPGVPILFN